MPIHSLILSLNDTTKTHNSPIHSHANRKVCSLQKCAIKVKADFGLITIFLLTLTLIADKSFYSVV